MALRRKTFRRDLSERQEEETLYMEDLENRIDKIAGYKFEIKGTGMDRRKGDDTDHYYIELDKIKEAVEEWCGRKVDYRQGSKAYLNISDSLDFKDGESFQFFSGLYADDTVDFALDVYVSIPLSYCFVTDNSVINKALSECYLAGLVSLKGDAELLGRNAKDFDWEFPCAFEEAESTITDNNTQKFKFIRFYIDRSLDSDLRFDTDRLSKIKVPSEQI